MPLLNRDTIVDRPVLVDREQQDESSGEVETDPDEVPTLGEGGGPEISGLEFGPEDEDLVAASNLVAVLSSATDSGPMFEESFKNAAIQLYELRETDDSITPLVEYAVGKGIHDIGVPEEAFTPETEEVEEEPESEIEEEIDDVEEVEEIDDEMEDEEQEDE